MTTVFFSKNGVQAAEVFDTDDAARRWAVMIQENGYTLECLLEQ